ncbi:hypothetical protein IWQ60_002395 [Tieghemiomyces parasiticus]|uniref:Nudix hydrolase domain-containing protein n=1 Tax=Tieghemiomyces parasiticus TaxID=78921 RepID=A0A9W8E118_9FUNG|nr:hypothetical protein IWQ60_002395 [Tieghemiomyces parasiticus]
MLGGTGARLLLHSIPLPDAEDLPYRLAGLRELTEECSLALVTDRQASQGAPVALPAAAAEALQRVGLDDGAAAYARWLSSTPWTPAIRHLLPWAHWLTPEGTPARYSTRFYLMAYPGPPPAVRFNPTEASGARWLAPAEALHEFAAGRMTLWPPQWTILHDLQQFPTLDGLVAHARTHPVLPILPHFTRDPATKQPLALLPGDEAYPHADYNEGGSGKGRSLQVRIIRPTEPVQHRLQLTRSPEGQLTNITLTRNIKVEPFRSDNREMQPAL